jgi:hypothetical protein
MGKKIIRLTESDLERIVKKVISEEKNNKKDFFVRDLKSNFKDTEKRTYKIWARNDVPDSVKGKPEIVKDNKSLLLTSGMTIRPNDRLRFGAGDSVTVYSIDPSDKKTRQHQMVDISMDNNLKPEIFVYSN